jgi:bifunctional DNA-binding transcriptional regulator/antitoxin component of YhaV-PrlF toxin-antitoxin module
VPYNEFGGSYNEVAMSKMSWVMKVSSNGQVSIPAEVRSRWNAEAVQVVDMGDYLVIGPHRDRAQVLRELQGKYAGRGPSTDEMRREEREAEEERERRKYGG